MAKTINVDAHIKRYSQTEPSDVIRLIEGLQKLVETKREAAIQEAERNLEILRGGSIPPPTPKPEPQPRKTRGGKPTTTE